MKNFYRFAALVGCALFMTGAGAQEPQAGQLLFANPILDEPAFEHTVLLIVHHDDDGSIALALNRPTWVEPTRAFPEETVLADYAGELFVGGPNAPNQALFLFESDATDAGNARRVIGDIYVSTDLTLLSALLADEQAQGGLPPGGADARRIRLFAGHAAWIAGQLEQEIASGTWELVPALADQVFSTHPESLWVRQPGATGAVTAALR